MKYLTGSPHLPYLTVILYLFLSSANAQTGILDTFSVSIPSGQIGAYCYDDNSLPGDIDTVYNACPEQSGTFAQVFIQNDTTGCVEYFGIEGGIDTACIVICDDLTNCDSIILMIEVITPLIPCQAFWDETVINMAISDCTQRAGICLPLHTEKFSSFDLSLNSMSYTNGLTPCQQDSLVQYPYTEIFGQGNQGPYLLESWLVNGDSFTAVIPNIDVLVDSMNIWNPSGNWEHDISGSRIVGNAPDSYGAIIISAVDTPSAATTVYPQLQYFYKGIELYFDLGTSQFIATDPMTDCADTLQVNVICAPTEPLNQIVYSGTAGVICLDTGDLPGQEFLVRNFCEETSGESVTFQVFDNDPCLNYMTFGEGRDSACIIICDELGFCDTTYVIVNVIQPIDGFVEQTILIGEERKFCVDTTELIGNITQFYNICQDQEATNLTLDSQFSCLTFTGLSVGTDSACIVICDDLGGCDTTIYEIHVAELFYPLPEAVADYDTLVAGTTTIIEILANDHYETADIINVFENPKSGHIVINSALSFTYQPDPGFCGADYFVYEICSQRGECSQAYVHIHVICDELTIYSGFSPNGDGKNDFFTIEGLELYPESVLQVYNRWGARVFEAVQYGNDWQGTWHNVSLPEGTYYYILDLNDEKGRTYSGAIFIAR